MTGGATLLDDTATSQPSTPTSHPHNGEHIPSHAHDGPGSPTHSRQTGSYIFGEHSSALTRTCTRLHM